MCKEEGKGRSCQGYNYILIWSCSALSFLARFYVRAYVLYICRGIYDSCRLHLFICSNQATGGGSKMVGQMAGHVDD